MPDKRDIKLVQQLNNNDVKAFNALFHKYSQNLYRFSFSLLKNKEDSEGIVQEVFLRIWSKRNEIDSGKSFKSFLFKISYNLIINQFKARLKDKEFLMYLEQYFSTKNIPPVDEVDYHTIKDQIDRIVEELPEKRKQIFKLSREDELSHKEISERLDISVKTVENQINLALRHLKARWGREILPILLFLSLFT